MATPSVPDTVVVLETIGILAGLAAIWVVGEVLMRIGRYVDARSRRPGMLAPGAFPIIWRAAIIASAAYVIVAAIR